MSTGPNEPPAGRPEDGRTIPVDVGSGTPVEATADTESFAGGGAGTAAELPPGMIPPDLVEHPRYEVLGYLGAGGMGTVFKARHRRMERVVALKVINAALVSRPVMVERFQREVKAAARLAHPNIVAAYDADQAGATRFLVMEYVAGVDLDRVLKTRGPLPIADACNYARQSALGLQHAFEQGMVHRDIKPHNLMLTPAGLVKILDFGLARFVSEVAPPAPQLLPPAAPPVPPDEPAPEPAADVAAEPEAAPTAVPSALPGLMKGTAYAYTGAGTADYIAPEEALDARRADIRADIYSLGCTLYRFLAGRVPFPEGTLIDKLKNHLETIPDRLTALRPEVPARLAAIVEQMMAKDPARRIATPAEVAQALAPFARRCDSCVLVVEDDPTTRQALAMALEEEGFTVDRAANGREALDRLRSAALPRLILLDLMMPVMDGWDFLRAVKADPALAAIPVIVVSAADRGAARAAALGAADFLRKPVELDQLADKVRDHTAAS